MRLSMLPAPPDDERAGSATAARRRARRARSRMAVLAVLTAVLIAGSATYACGPLRPVTADVAEALISVEEERRLGDELARELETEVELLDDADVQRYVQDLGDRLLASAPEAPEGMAYRFRVIDAPDQVNAVALPGGYVYVFSGLLLAAGDEAELTGVLAHELAHVTERHIAERLVAQLGVDALAQVALGRDPGLARQLATAVAAQGVLTRYSREMEREADYYGVLYLARAGWYPESYAQFFDKLAAQSDRPEVLAFLQTHPAPAERAENARALIASLTAVPTFTGERRYERVRSRVGQVVGDATPSAADLALAPPPAMR